MSRIKWDQTGERRYETGVKNGVLYVQKADGTYENGVAWNGLTSVSESPEGADPNDLWADDIKYLSLRSAEDLKATIEAYTYPDEWMACDGSQELVPGVVVGQQTRVPFGVIYTTTQGNDTQLDAYGEKIHIIYNATASPSERAYESINDSPEAITFSWEISTTPIEIPTVSGKTYKKSAMLTIDSTRFKTPAEKAVYEAFKDYIYGTENTDPKFPTPAKVIELFTMTDVPVQGVGLAPAAITLTAGDTYQLSVVISPANATDQTVAYTSSDESAATVSDEGLVTAVAAGSTTITVTTDDGDFTDTCAVTVTSA